MLFVSSLSNKKTQQQNSVESHSAAVEISPEAVSTAFGSNQEKQLDSEEYEDITLDLMKERHFEFGQIEGNAILINETAVKLAQIVKEQGELTGKQNWFSFCFQLFCFV